MTIYLATDHAGFELKEDIKEMLVRDGRSVSDMGAYSFDASDDYNEFVGAVALRVQQDSDSRGIIFGGSGQGEAMQANRVKGVRAAVFYGGSFDIVRLSREHNNANVLSIGARFVDKQQAKDAVRQWLEIPFTDQERHARRNKKLDT